MTLYLNNQPVFQSMAGPTSYPFATGDMMMGHDKADLTWVGDVDDLRIWNRGLSAAEIQTQYQRLSSATCIILKTASAVPFWAWS